KYELINKLNINLWFAFRCLDINNNGYIILQDFINLLLKYNINSNINCELEDIKQLFLSHTNNNNKNNNNNNNNNNINNSNNNHIKLNISTNNNNNNDNNSSLLHNLAENFILQAENQDNKSPILKLSKNINIKSPVTDTTFNNNNCINNSEINSEWYELAES